MPEPRYRLIVMDLDGTLLDARSRVTDRTRAALFRAHESGVALAVATGRSYPLLRYFCGDLPLRGPQITCNGAILIDAESGLPTFAQPVSPALVVPVLDFLREQGVYSCFYTDEAIYVHDHSTLEAALVPPDFPQPIAVPDLRALAGRPCFKLVAVAAPEGISALRPRAEAAFGRRLYVTQTSRRLLEFLHPAVSKGAALREVMAELGVHPEQVIAFGDSHNDIELLQAAGTGVAMGNAGAEVRAVADMIAPANTEDGIAVILDQVLWS